MLLGANGQIWWPLRGAAGILDDVKFWAAITQLYSRFCFLPDLLHLIYVNAVQPLNPPYGDHNNNSVKKSGTAFFGGILDSFGFRRGPLAEAGPPK